MNLFDILCIAPQTGHSAPAADASFPGEEIFETADFKAGRK